MFESKAAMFLYAISPVHMGAGTAIGAIDNPIQRERHTGHPMIAGSGLKGALRHEANALWGGREGLVERIFGPDPDTGDASDHAGAVSVGDAQIVLFPVRSLRRSYVYATCPTALGRLRRLIELAGLDNPVADSIPTLSGSQCALVNEQLRTPGSGNLVLETFEFQPATQHTDAVRKIGAWLKENAIAAGVGSEYFRDKIGADTVLLTDDNFNYFVHNATVVEPHVRIADESGTADEGGLFYTENLPPETLLVSLLMASRERVGSRNGTAQPGMPAGEILRRVRGGTGDNESPGFDGRLLQVGGDATTGRGHVLLRLAMKE